MLSQGVGQTSVLCVPNCREPTNSPLTRPPAQAQEIAFSMPPLGMGSDLKYSSLQINALHVLHDAAFLISLLVYFGGISCLLSQTLTFRNMLHKEELMN